MRLLRLYFLMLCLFLTSEFVFSQEVVTGKVVAITDGDTFRLLTQDSVQLKVRVANIDCPERKQPFYKRAKQFTSDAVFGKTVNLHVLKKDRYGRYVALVTYNDSLDLSQALLKHGMAWHYVKYSQDSSLQALEDSARNAKLGLWVEPRAMAPWNWRKRKQKQKTSP